jgi:hypothetical protein
MLAFAEIVFFVSERFANSVCTEDVECAENAQQGFWYEILSYQLLFAVDHHSWLLFLLCVLVLSITEMLTLRCCVAD